MKVLFAVFLFLFWSGWAAAQTGPCTASFTYTNSSPGIYSFINTSTPGMPGSATWSWDFGDGTTATATNPTHTFSASGTYCVTLTIATGNGCMATDTQCITVTGGSTPIFNCANVNAAFIYSVHSSFTTYLFTSTSTNTNVAASTVSYNWVVRPSTGLYTLHFSGSPALITFPSTGYYCITLYTTWSDTAGAMLCQDSATQCITVIGPAPSVNCTNINAAFTTSNFGTTYNFTDATTNTSTTPVVKSYYWEFGDGSTDTISSPTHTYTAGNGNYTVILTVTWMDSTNNTQFCTSTTFQTLNVIENKIKAYANWDSAINASGASVKFWIISYDSSSQMLTAVDSAIIPCSSQVPYVYAEWFNKPAGNFRVKAHMIDQPASWTTGFLPTYADSAFNWQAATVVSHTGLTSVAAIYLRQGIPMTGPGFISGSVLQGANKGTAVGDPMGNITVFLRNNANNTLVASTETDANGMYTFTGVPVGSYNVYPEELNYATTPSAPIQITATNTNSTANDFWRETVAKTLHPIGSASVKATKEKNQIVISPNPAKDQLNIQFATAPQQGSTVQLYNLSGQLVKAFQISDAQTTQQLSLSGIAAGQYLLHIPTQKGTQVARITVQP